MVGPRRVRLVSPVSGEIRDAGSEVEEELYTDRTYRERSQRDWERRMSDVKLGFLDTFSQIGRASALIAFLVVLYLGFLVLAHYTGPSYVRWLTESELSRLENFYSRAAAVAVPGMLMGNAWLIWMASRRPNR